MAAWKDWSPHAGGQEKEVLFSCLQHLVVQNCPTLIGTLPDQLDNLVKLEIRSCPHLIISSNVVHLPSLRELYIEDCNKEILKGFVNLTSLSILDIENIAELICFDYGFTSCLVKLKELHVIRCDELKYLWRDENEWQNLVCLERLVINSCHRLTSFVERGGEEELPCNLQRMNLRSCTSLEKLPSKMQALRNLSIWNCPKITGLNTPQYDPRGNDPMNQLISLEIRGYDSPALSPFTKERLLDLKTLQICKCKGLDSLEEIIPEQLEEIRIKRCETLGSLSRRLYTHPHLTRLELWNCPALEVFPSLPITLSYLRLVDCPKIKSLSNEWHHHTSLQGLFIWDCPSIKCFPKGGFPPNPRELGVVRCENLEQPVRQWGLRLTLPHIPQDSINQVPHRRRGWGEDEVSLGGGRG